MWMTFYTYSHRVQNGKCGKFLYYVGSVNGCMYLNECAQRIQNMKHVFSISLDYEIRMIL